MERRVAACITCHWRDSRAANSDYFPRLAGKPARYLLMAEAALGRTLVFQGTRRAAFPPVTEGNSRPYGRLPFGHLLDDAKLAAVLTYVRGGWGNT